MRIDRPRFLAREDIIWDVLPAKFDEGAFLGNGLLGSTIYRDGDHRVRWEMGRSDVTELRRDNARLPIGGLILTTVGKIEGGNMRLDLWNAEVRGEIKTDKGTVCFRSFIHSDGIALFTDLETTAGEEGAKFAWEARPAVDRVNKQPANEANPAPRSEYVDGIAVCEQPRFAGGAFATVWCEVPADRGRRVGLSIADTFPGNTAAARPRKRPPR